MRSSIPLLLLLGALVPLGPTASASERTEGRDLEVAEAIVAAFNEPDDALRRERLGAVLGASERTAHIATALSFLASRHGRVAVEEIVESTDTWARVVLRGEREGDYLTLEVEYEPGDDAGIASVGFRPGRPAERAATPIGVATKREVLGAIAQLLRSEYVLVDQRERLADAVESWQPERFSGADDASRFARALTRELRRLQEDKHLAVLDPSEAAGRWEDPSAVDGEGHGHETPGHEIPGQGFGAAEILDGNVGYLEMEAFDGSRGAIDRLEEIMSSFAEVDAMVLDLRACRGGEPAMVVALSSYFLPRPTLLAVSVSPWTEGSVERWAGPTQIPRLGNVPLYVLSSSMTASAAESFVFGMRRNDRITLVGETTAGAGHLADLRRLPGDFGLQIPVGRTYDPETGKGWEGVGMEPEIVAGRADALDRALEAIATGR